MFKFISESDNKLAILEVKDGWGTSSKISVVLIISKMQSWCCSRCNYWHSPLTVRHRNSRIPFQSLTVHFCSWAAVNPLCCAEICRSGLTKIWSSRAKVPSVTQKPRITEGDFIAKENRSSKCITNRLHFWANSKLALVWMYAKS